MLISLPELILNSRSVTARGHSPHKQQMSLNYWYYLNFCKMHAFHFSRPFSRVLVREVCLHVKGLSAQLPAHKTGTGRDARLSLCFSSLLWGSQSFPSFIFYPVLSLPVVRLVCCQSGHLSIYRQSGDVFLARFLFFTRHPNRDIISVWNKHQIIW